MSLFLAYFEIGRPVAPSQPQGMVARSFVVRFKGRVNRARLAMLFTDAERFFPRESHAVSLEGDLLCWRLLKFFRERLALGARPHFVFLLIGGPLDEATIDGDHVTRVPIRILDQKLRSMARFPINDSSEVIEVTTGDEPDAEEYQAPPMPKILLDVSSDNVATELDPMRWKGRIDILVGDTLLSIGRDRGSVLMLPSFAALADVVHRLRAGARTAAHKLPGDTSTLHFVRDTTGGVHAAHLAYRGTETPAVPVGEIDTACRDAVLQFLRGLSPEQRGTLTTGRSARLLETIATVWPEVRPSP